MDRVGAVPRELTEAVCLFPRAGIEDGEQCVFISAEGRVVFPQLTHIVWLTVCCNFMFFFIRDRCDTALPSTLLTVKTMLCQDRLRTG